MPKNTAAKKTLVTLLLDRSSSMEKLRSSTVEAVNAYIQELKESEGKYRFTFLQFDSDTGGRIRLEPVISAKKVKNVEKLTTEDFKPRGMTPLVDASVMTIRSVEETVGDRDVNVVVAIQTDGQENSSTKHSWEELKALISEKEKAGWQFVFLGAGINAYEQGARMGISGAKTISYSSDMAGTQAAFRATAQSTVSFAAGDAAEMSYSAQSKLAAGDKWMPDGDQKHRA